MPVPIVGDPSFCHNHFFRDGVTFIAIATGTSIGSLFGDNLALMSDAEVIRPYVCSHHTGQGFDVEGENLIFPPGGQFHLYSLAALLPLLNNLPDWRSLQ